MYKRIKPYLADVKDYLASDNVEYNLPINPFGVDAELLKLLRNFALIPEANLMIERSFDLRGKENQVFKPEDQINETIVLLMKRGESYVKQFHLRAEGQKYILEGLLPYIYKYTSCLLNLTNFEIKSRGMNPYSKNPKALDVDDLLTNIETARELYKLYKERHSSIAEILNKNNQHTLFDGFEMRLDNDVDSITEDGGKKDKDMLQKSGLTISNNKMNLNGQEQVEALTEKLIIMCKKVLKDIEKFYEHEK